jgi:hypothetical protein
LCGIDERNNSVVGGEYRGFRVFELRGADEHNDTIVDGEYRVYRISRLFKFVGNMALQSGGYGNGVKSLPLFEKRYF